MCFRVSPAVREATVLVVVTKSVPEAERHTDVVHHISRALQYLQQIRNSALVNSHDVISTYTAVERLGSLTQFCIEQNYYEREMVTTGASVFNAAALQQEG